MYYGERQMLERRRAHQRLMAFRCRRDREHDLLDDAIKLAAAGAEIYVSGGAEWISSASAQNCRGIRLLVEIAVRKIGDPLIVEGLKRFALGDSSFI